MTLEAMLSCKRPCSSTCPLWGVHVTSKGCLTCSSHKGVGLRILTTGLAALDKLKLPGGIHAALERMCPPPSKGVIDRCTHALARPCMQRSSLEASTRSHRLPSTA